MEAEKLMESVKEGFANLEISAKYKESALEWLKIWLTDNAYADYVPQIEYLIEVENWAFLMDSFYQVIPFGTGVDHPGLGPGTLPVSDERIRGESPAARCCSDL
jgi:phosphoglucomutase/phosphomannomutase